MKTQIHPMRYEVFAMLGFFIGAVVSSAMQNIFGNLLWVLSPTFMGLILGTICGFFNPERRDRIKNFLYRLFHKLFRKKEPNPKLPRTWGKDLLLIRKSHFKQIWERFSGTEQRIANKINIVILALFFGLIIITYVLQGTKLALFIIGISCFALSCSVIIYCLILSSRTVLRPLYFSRITEAKSKNRDRKIETFKNQLPEDDYRTASLTPPEDKQQIRILLEANRPLTREQLAEAEAILEAEKELEEAQNYAELAKTLSKTQPS